MKAKYKQSLHLWAEQTRLPLLHHAC